jgi:hypothetical protein
VAKIVVIRHAAEQVGFPHHAIGALIALWRTAGHEVDVVYGVRNLPPADLAILHVDLSVVPGSYREAAKVYRRVVNGNALDIRKRRVSRNLLARGDTWPGPVVVKSDLNCSGWPEWRMRERTLKLGREPPDVPEPVDPIIYKNLAEVPDVDWDNPHLVVERFVAEREGENFAIRHWIFFGDRERARRCLSPDPIIKGLNIVGVEDSAVPDEIRAHRKRLGLDFGKMDFIIRNGIPVLFDANKTIGPVPGSAKAGLPEFLAGGLDAMLAGAALSA